MQAIISDIHGNLEALSAVSAEIRGLDVICLGDMVCYGPDSIECVRRSADWSIVIAGPLDLALLDQVHGQWSATLNKYIQQTRERFSADGDSELLFSILSSYLTSHEINGCRFYHGTLNDVRGYIFPEEIYCPTNIDQIVGTQDHAHIAGGSHLPGIFRRHNDGKWEYEEPENGIPYELPRDGKTVVTIGSVGQPRDGDPRASYALMNDTSIVFHRVDYDVQSIQAKILKDPDLDDIHARRLPEGR